MKKTFFLMLLFLALSINIGSAMEITSPFGWRTHPITGNSRLHSGVDVAGDYGDNIVAPMDGYVSFAGYDERGYGYYLIVDHPDGTQTLYGHCNNFYVSAGQTVKAGQIIAAVGSTGGSTGPHVHVEYLVNGAPTDPMPFLTSHGWDLTYGGSPVVIAGEFGNSDFNDMPWSFGDFYDVASDVRKILDEFADVCQQSINFIMDDAMVLLKYLLIIDFAFSAILRIMDKEGDMIRFMAVKFIRYGLIIFLVTNWKLFVNSYILDSFTQIGITAGGGGTYVGDNISDPSKIIQKGFFLVHPVFDYLTQYTGLHLIANVHNIFLAMFLGLAIVACFAFIGIQFFLVYLEFYITAALTLILVPFGSTANQFKYLGEKGIGSVFSIGIKLMIMTIVVGLIVNTVKDMTTPVYDHVIYLRILLASLTMAFFSSRIPNNLTKLLAGSPKF